MHRPSCPAPPPLDRATLVYAAGLLRDRLTAVEVYGAGGSLEPGHEATCWAGRDEHREQGPLVHEEDDLPARPVDEIRVPVPEARGRRDHLHDRHRAEAREQFLRAAKGEHVVPLPHAR